MMDPEVQKRISARRAELDELEEQLVKQLSEVRAERDELAVAARVLQRMSEQLDQKRAASGSPVVQVAGRAVRLVPDRATGVDASALPVDYQRMLTAVRQAAGRSWVCSRGRRPSTCPGRSRRASAAWTSRSRTW